MAAQVPLFMAAAGGGATECRVLTRDSDNKFGRAFDTDLRAKDITPVRLPHRAPNLNAHVERFIQTLQMECLDKFIVMGIGHLDQLKAEFIEHYNTERPHSSIGFRTPEGRPPPRGDAPPSQSTKLRDIRCRTRLGGVLRPYYRQVAA